MKLALLATILLGVQPITVKDNSVLKIKGHRMECLQTSTSFQCTEIGYFPRLIFYADKTDFYIMRIPMAGAQMETLYQAERRK